MLKKLQAIYPNSIMTKQKPEDYFSRYHWFSHESEEWIGIPKDDLVDNQLNLLRSLFDYYHTGNDSFHTSALAQGWYLYLFENGPMPLLDSGELYRLIYFQWTSGSINHLDFEAALQAFFDSKITVIWENAQNGIIIEPKKKHPLTENDFMAMYETLKSDFFVEPFFYIGKFRTLSEEFLTIIRYERSLLVNSRQLLKKERVFYFEILTPKYVAMNLPDILITIIKHDIIPVFQEDPELFLTIKVFLQNNMNASITAKNLFIHRNTLQYRLDKFTEKTGIILKDLNSAITVNLACTLFENAD